MSAAPLERAEDVAARRQFRLLAALLDHEAPPWRPGEMPPLGHWLLFPPAARQSDIGPDGHPKRSDDSLPRRMWAGSRVRFLAPVPLGAPVVRETELIAEAEKTGRSGRMRFVTFRHRIHVEGTAAIEEEQDIVYRAAAKPGAPQSPPPDAPALPPPIVRHIHADPVQLFRFSALTFNGHRIHYDRPYAVNQEGYPALVVQGPFLATLLMDLYLRSSPGAHLSAFSFRALRPVFDTHPFTLGLTPDACGGALAVMDATASVAMSARVDLA